METTKWAGFIFGEVSIFESGEPAWKIIARVFVNVAAGRDFWSVRARIKAGPFIRASVVPAAVSTSARAFHRAS